MYKDIFDRIDKIRTKYGEVLFRCGLSHLFAKGTDHFDDENVEATIKTINAQDDSRMVVPNGFQIDIVKCAKDLKQKLRGFGFISHWHSQSFVGLFLW